MSKNSQELPSSIHPETKSKNAIFKGFENMPPELVSKLKNKLIEGDRETQNLRTSNPYEHPKYTEKELIEIAQAFILFNRAVKQGLPNNLYEMFIHELDVDIAKRAHRLNAIWVAHDGPGMAMENIQAFADGVKKEIKKRDEWDEYKFHEEYFLEHQD